MRTPRPGVKTWAGVYSRFMNCRLCGEETLKLVCASDGLACAACRPPTYVSHSAALGRIRVPYRKFGVELTHADAMRIKTNKKRTDGRYRPDPRWRTSGD